MIGRLHMLLYSRYHTDELFIGGYPIRSHSLLLKCLAVTAEQELLVPARALPAIETYLLLQISTEPSST